MSKSSCMINVICVQLRNPFRIDMNSSMKKKKSIFFLENEEVRFRDREKKSHKSPIESLQKNRDGFLSEKKCVGENWVKFGFKKIFRVTKIAPKKERSSKCSRCESNISTSARLCL